VAFVPPRFGGVAPVLDITPLRGSRRIHYYPEFMACRQSFSIREITEPPRSTAGQASSGTRRVVILQYDTLESSQSLHVLDDFTASRAVRKTRVELFYVCHDGIRKGHVLTDSFVQSLIFIQPNDRQSR